MGDQMRKLKRFLLVIAILAGVFAIYVEIVNRNSKHMTYRQKILKAVYPAFMWLTNLTKKNTTTLKNDKQPPVSFYSLSAIMNNGKTFSFEQLKGKKILLVNTASDCGYTNQYADLQRLSERYAGKLLVLGFPANDFREQEKGSDEEIAQFCKLNFGVTFPLMKKSVVIKGDAQNSVYQWLTDPAKNGWNSQVPSWNFSKYLVNEQGVLTHYFGPSVAPESDELINALK